MTSAERVTAAINFQRPDRLPRWDEIYAFGTFPQRWRKWKGLADEVDPTDYYGMDMSVQVGDEGAFFSRAEVLRQEGAYQVYRDTWGRILRHRPGEAWFMEPVETPLEEKSQLDTLEFDDPDDDRRYTGYLAGVQAERQKGKMVFTKIGGLYIRSAFLRREDRLLVDMATDEGFCRALFGRMADHLTQIALAQLRRSEGWEAGVFVYDDCASSRAPMFSPAMWDKYFLPLYAEMIARLRAEGCRHFYLHSDGAIGPLLDGLLEAGFEGFNPLEPRCGLDLVKLREKYGQRIVFFGGVCNTQILPSGDQRRIEAHVRPLIELGRAGGLIIGQASIGDDITPETYDFYISLLEKYGWY